MNSSIADLSGVMKGLISTVVAGAAGFAAWNLGIRHILSAGTLWIVHLYESQTAVKELTVILTSAHIPENLAQQVISQYAAIKNARTSMGSGYTPLLFTSM